MDLSSCNRIPRFLTQRLSDKLGAVAAIDALMGTATTQSEAIKQRFSRYLSNALRRNTDYRLLERVGAWCDGILTVGEAQLGP